MAEQLIQNALPSSDQLLRALWYAVAVLCCVYTAMGTFFVLLFVKRHKTEKAEAPCVEMHNNSARKWLKLVFSKPANDNLEPELPKEQIDGAFGGIIDLLH